MLCAVRRGLLHCRVQIRRRRVSPARAAAASSAYPRHRPGARTQEPTQKNENEKVGVRVSVSVRVTLTLTPKLPPEKKTKEKQERVFFECARRLPAPFSDRVSLVRAHEYLCRKGT